MINFKTVLEEIVRIVPGCTLAMIVGRDGVIVEFVSTKNSGLDTETAGAEYSGVISEVHKQISMLKLDEFKDVTICLNSSSVVANLISPDYYFMVFLTDWANEGLARYKTRVCSLKLRELL
jgi:predicted regulator of Ras-like GTPase activity (Roadblock/LC7/MglB family)